nr:hypothetical protein [Cytophagales bacterium]
MNIGIIGAGNFSIKHVNAIHKVPGLRVKAICRRNQDELNKLVKTHGIFGCEDYEEIIEDPTIQIVLISTPHHLHAEIAEKAARKGKHLMIEKPLASTWADCLRIYNASVENNVKIMPGHIGRFTPAFMEVKKYLTARPVGSILSARATSVSLWKNQDRQPWHLQQECGGGYLLTLGVHQIDLLCALIPAKVVKVYAKLQNSFHQDNIDDCGSAILEFGNGVVANLQLAGYQIGKMKVETELFYERGMMKISFSEGGFFCDAEHWSLLPGSNPPNWLEHGLINEWTSFKKMLEGDGNVEVSLGQAMHVMEIIFAIFSSSRLGRPVDIPPSEYI